MKIFKVNELKENTYNSASRKLLEKGHRRRSFEIKKWASKNRKIEGEYQFLSPEVGLFEASIFTYIHFYDIYAENVSIEDVHIEDDEVNDDFTESNQTSSNIEKELKLSRKWADLYFNDFLNKKDQISDRISNIRVYFEIIPNNHEINIGSINIQYELLLIYKRGSKKLDIKLSKDSFNSVNNYYFANRKNVVKFLNEVKSYNFIKNLNDYDDNFRDFLYEYDILGKIKSEVAKIPVNDLYKD